MVDAMTKAKGTLGPKYDVCGGDGFHPGPDGQLLMAYAFRCRGAGKRARGQAHESAGRPSTSRPGTARAGQFHDLDRAEGGLIGRFG
jgi:hypothetical protein